MFRQDKISIAITFVIGLIAGSYLYLTGFATTFELPEASTDDVYNEFVIIGDTYGVCDQLQNCLSFQLLENGSYRAIVENGNEDLVKEGKIPRSLRTELDRALNAVALDRQSDPLQFPECRYDITTENNYNFSISKDQINYDLDTCETRIDYQGAAWVSLVKLLNYFTSLEF